MCSAASRRTLQVVADGTDSNSTNVALGYARAAHRRLRAGSAGGASRRPARPSGSSRAAIRVWFNPDLESRDFMIPGIVALLLLVVTTNLSAMAIVREKELGTLEQLNVTPLARWELIVGKLLPYALIGMIDVVLVLVVAIYWFEVPMRGSLALLFAMSLVYLLTTLGLGLFISTISATQQQAMMTTTFFFLMPMIYLSGFIFPIENMPAWIQPITYLIPLRYFLVILRGDLPEGRRPGDLLAAGAGAARLGPRDPGAGDPAIEQAARVDVGVRCQSVQVSVQRRVPGSRHEGHEGARRHEGTKEGLQSSDDAFDQCPISRLRVWQLPLRRRARRSRQAGPRARGQGAITTRPCGCIVRRSGRSEVVRRAACASALRSICRVSTRKRARTLPKR